MDHLRVLARQGRTVIFTIHQPRQAIFDMFDRVEIISGGYLVYSGDRSGVPRPGYRCRELVPQG